VARATAYRERFVAKNAGETTLEIKSILIATPTTGGLIKSKTAETLVNLVKRLTKVGVEADIQIINNSDVVTARNHYANMVHGSGKWDALLFVDSDMSFQPAVILRLIEFNALISAVACTKKMMRLDQFAKSFAMHNDVELARAESVYFNTMLSWGGPRRLRRAHGFITAAAVGMAVCLIKKQALNDMVAGGVVEQRVSVYEGVKSTSWGFFDYTKHDGITLTEDYAFCYRWNKLLDRPLWVCIDAAVDHIGDFHFSGNYARKLETQLHPNPALEEEAPKTASPAKGGSAKIAAKRRKRSSAD
jgi:hypothetical protein